MEKQEKKLNWSSLEGFFHESWKPDMKRFIESEECWNISQYLKAEKAKGRVILPEGQYIWNAFKNVDLKNLKVVFIGLSPYFTPGIADGMAFSCSRTNKEQPSLKTL